MTPDVSVIIVSWNVCDALQKNLQQLFSLSTRVSFEVIVVDNGSKDSTAVLLRQSFPRVEFIQNDTNRGFAYACNQGLKRASGRVLVLFNPDMRMGRGVLEYTLATLQNRPEIGVMGVKLLRPDGTRVDSVRRDPHLRDQLAIMLKLPHFFPQVLDRYLAKDFDYEHDVDVEQVRGSFFAFRRDVYERVGELDAKNFFVWFEEVDFCRRVRAAGWKIWYSAQVSCTDLVGQSFKQQSNRLKQARFTRSMARYFLKWHGPAQASLIYVLRPLSLFMAVVADVFGLRPSTWK
ncbi:glycosyltransferase family 2 protein [Candidatus Uhrbacteria bacterium]|nr:glycosyltransferase family 2 protein [Candidatus Uhrbacteria bacterium]